MAAVSRTRCAKRTGTTTRTKPRSGSPTRARGARSRQLTNAKKSSQSPAWSPDGARLAFISDRTDKRQIYVINPPAGEAEALTSARRRHQQLRVVARRQEHRLHRDRAEARRHQGSREEIRRVRGGRTGLPDDAPLRDRPRHARHAHADQRRVLVGSFQWSPDGKSIAFDHRVNSALASSDSADISIVTVADGSVRKLVTQPGPDSHPVWSPDGSRVAFETAMANPAFFYTQRPHRDRPRRRRRADRPLRGLRRRSVDRRVEDQAVSSSRRPSARIRTYIVWIPTRRPSRRFRLSNRPSTPASR